MNRSRNHIFEILAVILITTVFAKGEAIVTKELLDATKRQSAWTNLVTNAPHETFEDEADRQDHLEATVSHVIECPQPQGSPMYAVFLNGPKNKPEGRFTFVEPDGKRIKTNPCDGNNMLESYETIADINGDGVIEIVSKTLIGDEATVKTHSIDEITVFQVLPQEQPIFTLLFNWHRDCNSLLSIMFKDNYAEVQNSINGNGSTNTPIRPKNLGKDSWFWRVTGSAALGYKIEIGPVEKEMFVTKASFQWSAKDRRFEGPKGSIKAKFLSFDGEVSDSEWDDFCKQLK